MTILIFFRYLNLSILIFFYLLWNIKIIDKTTIMIDMFVKYNEYFTKESKFSKIRNFLYILCIMNQCKLQFLSIFQHFLNTFLFESKSWETCWNTKYKFDKTRFFTHWVEMITSYCFVWRHIAIVRFHEYARQYRDTTYRIDSSVTRKSKEKRYLNFYLVFVICLRICVVNRAYLRRNWKKLNNS